MMEEVLEIEGAASEEAMPQITPESEEKDYTGVENTEEDYAAIIEGDLEVLRRSIPGLEGIRDITELENPVRYGALRDLGLSPEEAYRASTPAKRAPRPDNRAHLRSSVPKAARSPEGSISYRDLERAREIFSGVSDAEIQRLYRKVTR